MFFMEQNPFILTEKNSLASRFVAQMRNINQQNDRLRFRFNLQRLGQILAYEISKTMEYQYENVQTPLANSRVALPKENPVLLTIFRAGLPFFQGFLDYFDEADCAFVGAYRAEHAEKNIKINTDYIASPSLEGREVILIDPMLATGNSVIEAVMHLSVRHGKPRKWHIAAAIAGKPGAERVMQTFPDAKLWIAALDDELNAASYIVPGLGDAGDLCFGGKI
jgi:uracil phosphoribosyltransferase